MKSSIVAEKTLFHGKWTQSFWQHPAVAQAVTFAVPDAQFGEDVAAAVVVRPNMAATANDIRQFVAARLAEYKVPTQVLIVAAIPQGTHW